MDTCVSLCFAGICLSTGSRLLPPPIVLFPPRVSSFCFCVKHTVLFIYFCLWEKAYHICFSESYLFCHPQITWSHPSSWLNMAGSVVKMHHALFIHSQIEQLPEERRSPNSVCEQLTNSCSTSGLLWTVHCSHGCADVIGVCQLRLLWYNIKKWKSWIVCGSLIFGFLRNPRILIPIMTDWLTLTPAVAKDSTFSWSIFIIAVFLYGKFWLDSDQKKCCSKTTTENLFFFFKLQILEGGLLAVLSCHC